METHIIRVKDKFFGLSLSSTAIQKATIDVAQRINSDYAGRKPLFIVVLNGAFVFAADLLRLINLECEVSFVKLSSYHGTSTTGTVRQLIGLDEVLHQRDVIIVEDIIDSGLSIEFLLEEVQRLNPASIAITTMLFKPDAFMKSYSIDYIGLNIPNEFIIGCGLDYDGFGRNLSDIYSLVESPEYQKPC